MIFQKMQTAVNTLIHKIHTHPFNIELAMGTLGLPKFLFYLQQDALYLTEYAKALAITAARLPQPKQSKEFLRFALGAIEAETELHRDFLHQHDMFHLYKIQQSPACFMYTNYLLKMASTESAEEAVACMLPCLWVYNEVGKKMLCVTEIKNNPYARWIELYASNDFENSVNTAIDITNELSQFSSPDLENKMIAAFSRATQLEYLFWEGAYQLEEWNLAS
jgi:thiaminase/transcriptional activator TenA